MSNTETDLIVERGEPAKIRILAVADAMAEAHNRIAQVTSRKYGVFG